MGVSYLQICLIELDSKVYGILVCAAVGSVINQGLNRSPRNISFNNLIISTLCPHFV